MPSIFTHGAVGIAAGAAIPFKKRGALFWTLSALLPMLPDLDVIGYALGVRRGSLWSHRGITHSLFAAMIVAVLGAALGARPLRMRRSAAAAYFFLIVALHGALDTLTYGGIGIALLAPFDATRYGAPWRPVPAAPFGLSFFGARGLVVFERELLWVWLPAFGGAALARLIRATHGAGTSVRRRARDRTTPRA